MGLIGTFAFASGTTSGYLYVYAYMLPNVTVSATPLDFGSFVPTDNYKTATATISVGASSGTVFSVALDAGANYDGTRRVADYLGDKLHYWIYNPDFSAQWGDNDHNNTFPWGGSVSGTSTGSLVNLTVNGYLAAYEANGAMPAYTYFSDYVLMTVYY
jgi:spore coat protein U-like protein